jgi:hypothetical protein
VARYTAGIRGSQNPWARPLEQRAKHMVSVAAGIRVAPVFLVEQRHAATPAPARG